MFYEGSFLPNSLWYYQEVKLEVALPSCLFESMAAIGCASLRGLLSSLWRVLAGHWEHPMAESCPHGSPALGQLV